MATASKRSRPQSDGESDHVSLQPTNIDANHCLDDDENDSGIGQGVVESSKSPSTTPKTNISSRDIVKKSTTIVSQPLVESDDDHRSRTTTTLALSLSQLPVLNSASGGFKLFVEQTPADQLSIYEEMLNRQPNRSINSDRMPDFNFRMLKLLREEWIKMSEKRRNRYEMMARKKLKQEGENVMPICERKFKSLKVIRADQLNRRPYTCFICAQAFHKTRTVQSHMIEKHDIIALYGCHYCLKGFVQYSALHAHKCAEFSMYLAQMALNGNVLVMKESLHVVVCAECNIQFPIINTTDLTYTALIRNHPCSSLRNVVMYFVSLPKSLPYSERQLKIEFVPWLSAIPINCRHCGYRFLNAIDIEKHTATHNDVVRKLKCSACPKTFFTDLFYRDHLSSHLGESANMQAFIEAVAEQKPVDVNASGGDSNNSGTVAFSDTDSSGKIRQIMCDLCGQFEKVTEFNKIHDCAVNYTRRLCVEGQLVKCPSVLFNKQQRGSTIGGFGPLIDLTRCETLDEVFTESLKEQFKKVISISFAISPEKSPLTQLPQPLPARAYSCVTCYHIVVGDRSAIEHHTTCHKSSDESSDIDIDDIIGKTMIPLSARNSRCVFGFSCPCCSTNICSINSLRLHLVSIHGILAQYQQPTFSSHKVNTNRVPNSSPMSIDANLDFQLSRTVKSSLSPVKRLSNSIPRQLTVIQPSLNNNNYAQSSALRYARVQPPSTLATSAAVSNTGAWFCPVCQQRYDTETNLTKHLTSHHTFMCQTCSACFVRDDQMQTHTTQCIGKLVPPNSSVQCPQSKCRTRTASAVLYYVHLIQAHPDEVNFDDKTGQIFPWFVNPLPLNADQRKLAPRVVINGRTVQKVQIQPRPPTPSQPIFNANYYDPSSYNQCYLCGLKLTTKALYELHMSKHPEKWSDCYICRLPLNDTKALYHHMATMHVLQPTAKRVGGSASQCSLCHQIFPLDDAAVRHLLFDCCTKNICQLCQNRDRPPSEMSPHLLAGHRKSCHPRSYERFSCNICNRTFAVAQSFEDFNCFVIQEHQCNVHQYQCPCSSTTIIGSQSAFRLHFLRHHYSQSTQSCLVCRKRYATQASFEQHVTQHLIMPVKFRKMLINAVLAIRTSTNATQSQSNVVTTIASNNNIDATGRSTAAIKTEETDDIVVVAQKTPLGGLLDYDDLSEVEILSQTSPTPINSIASTNETIASTISTAQPSIVADIAQLARLATQPVSIEHDIAPAAVSIQIVVDVNRPTTVAGSQQVSPMDVDGGETMLTTTTVDEDVMDFEVSRQDAGRSTSAMDTDATIVASNSEISTIDSTVDVHRPSTSESGENNCDELEKAVISISGNDDVPLPSSTTDHEEMVVPTPADAVRTVSTLSSPSSIEEIDHQRMTAASAVVELKSTVDDDDDISVVENVNCADNVISNTELSSAAVAIGSNRGRKAKHPCNHCSMHFITVAALNDHLKTHAYDAGATCTQVFGVPRKKSVYLCRLCCLAYEHLSVQQEHVKTHGNYLTCADCSQVCFNEQQMTQHNAAHKEKNKIVYGCSLCMIAFETEERLHAHNDCAHDQQTLYFCKLCGFGHTDAAVVIHHVTNRRIARCQPLSSLAVDYAIPIQRIGTCALKKLHYQPTDPVRYAQTLTESMVEKLRPAECVHRSFLTVNETLITCELCFSLVAASKFVLENERMKKMGGAVRLQMMTDQSSSLATQIATLSSSTYRPANAAHFSIPTPTGVGNMMLRPLRYTLSSAPQSPQLGSNQSLQQLNTLLLRPSVANAINAHRQVSIPAQQAMQQRPLYLNVVQQGAGCNNPSIASTDTAASSVIIRNPAQPPQLVSTTGITVSSHSTSQQQQSTSPTVGYTAADNLQCALCNDRFTSTAAAHVHRLKHVCDQFFCLECGRSARREMQSVMHVLSHSNGRSDSSAVSMSLRCPLCDRECLTVADFRRHITDFTIPAHQQLTHPVRHCVLRFATAAAAEAHQREHDSCAPRNNAPMNACCTLCGTVSGLWTHHSGASHVLTHALQHWLMCRECGLCFPQQKLLVEHFSHTHITFSNNPNVPNTCQPCKAFMPGGAVHLAEHIVNAHLVHGYKLKATMTIDIEDSFSRLFGFRQA